MITIIWIIICIFLALVGYYAGYVDGYRRACNLCLDELKKAQRQLDEAMKREKAEHER